MQNAAAQAEVLASHVIAYAEMRAAIGRMRREDRLTGNDAASVKRRFERHWKSVLRFIPEEPAIRQTGSFAERFGLKGYDGVHLACAFLLHKQSSMPLQFACFDFPLNKAALRLGFQVVTSVESGSKPSRNRLQG